MIKVDIYCLARINCLYVAVLHNKRQIYIVLNVFCYFINVNIIRSIDNGIIIPIILKKYGNFLSFNVLLH